MGGASERGPRLRRASVDVNQLYFNKIERKEGREEERKEIRKEGRKNLKKKIR